jgi:hypothetical protein
MRYLNNLIAAALWLAVADTALAGELEKKVVIPPSAADSSLSPTDAKHSRKFRQLGESRGYSVVIFGEATFDYSKEAGTQALIINQQFDLTRLKPGTTEFLFIRGVYDGKLQRWKNIECVKRNGEKVDLEWKNGTYYNAKGAPDQDPLTALAEGYLNAALADAANNKGFHPIYFLK